MQAFTPFLYLSTSSFLLLIHTHDLQTHDLPSLLHSGSVSNTACTKSEHSHPAPVSKSAAIRIKSCAVAKVRKVSPLRGPNPNRSISNNSGIKNGTCSSTAQIVTGTRNAVNR